MYILFDIGGTKTRVVGTEDLATFSQPIKFDTPKSFEEGIEKIVAAVEKLSVGAPVKALAGGLRGILNREKTGMAVDPGKALEDWEGRDIAAVFQEQLHAPTYIENDTAIVGLGEATAGAGKGYDIVAYLTVSTGVNGVKVEKGAIDQTSYGFEIGHQILDIDRSLLGGDTPHTLENLVSGTALEKVRGVKPYEIAQDDPVWDELAGYLARGLKNTIVYWSPDVIVLGGSMIVGDPRIFLEDIIRHTKEVLGDTIPCPEIVDATLKDEGGLYGAMALLKQKMA